VLETIAADTRSLPKILLRERDGASEPPLNQPANCDCPGHARRYRIDGEIAHHGMGAVWNGQDPDLRRGVTLAVLLEDYLAIARSKLPGHALLTEYNARSTSKRRDFPWSPHTSGT
jgi:hypothetical protein